MLKKDNPSKKSGQPGAKKKTKKTISAAGPRRTTAKKNSVAKERVREVEAPNHKVQLNDNQETEKAQDLSVDLQASRRFWLAVLGAVVVILVVVQSYGYLTGWGDPQKVIDRHFNQAQRMTMAKRYAAAIHEYEKVVAMKSTGDEIKQQALVGIADLYREQKDWEKAIRYYQTLQQQQAEGVMAAWAGLKIGECQVEAGQAAQALATYSLIRENYPDSDWDAEARLGQGQAYEALNQYKQAMQVYQDLEKDYHGGFLAAEAMMQVGHCYEQLGQKDKARTIYQQVIASYPDTMADEAKKRLQKLSYTLGPNGIREWKK